ncbi:MAG: hypothetical protein ABS21_07130 [SAR86 cluster bacterium BACL1 MAG-121105-bin34]|jgi:hypothetical protein|uniref:SnoaL-like domain-containing protein n=2 Tax=SAR86 cluster TaxID=62672 RepID=A0A0R2UEL8_9GAMM|nr:MAG: hypothetical protein ABR59_02625 [SAR86 cluster bacterium BACL1 MAG-120507-bin14]KRO40282.1 MAG: hypothetical protein ABR63_08650 [SAR86 cluster bacterium BACL1 MAG-120920-bin57]KRO95898.1 MAG: hypothetical protein ABS10_05540 [SAR86 cluster bacterium BACL1 MAG-120820-bin45]KRO96215.1 MAG: hypothetical protein ABS11_05525 [SAR86 cluster bacterium BACL1 MAG-120828-bin5]KRO97935.1 MAG: hypothetical protein ABS14_06220 [SAR86 cluster bacterium BACL1 MAG-120813-bin36]KRO98788.1 MAG: hypoth
MSKQDIATQIIYQYASMLDAKNFSDLPTIMWNDFSLTGPYELNSLEIFMGAVEQNLGAYQKTMHFIGNIEGRWDRDIYTGKTYCIASHMFAENGQSKKLDMGIIYDDTIELREGVAKFINRHFNLQWQKTDLLN